MSKMYYIGDCIVWHNARSEDAAPFRKNGACLISEDGDVYFSQLKRATYNRKHGPSIVRGSGMVSYRNIKGKLHRTNGPARILSNGCKEYWVNDKQLSSEEFFLTYEVV